MNADEVAALIEQVHEANAVIADSTEDLLDGLHALAAAWSAQADEANDAGIESPTMSIRAAVTELRAVLGGEGA